MKMQLTKFKGFGIRSVAASCLSVFLLGKAPLWADAAPYAGQEQREIASLSEGDVQDLLAGRGWGFAKAAELNGYPGPAHVLELADTLQMTSLQRARVQTIFDEMNTKARALGADLVAAEAALDAAFRDHTVDAEKLSALVRDAGTIESALRTVHLQAHLETRPLMNKHQIMLYNRARGYGSGGHSGGHGHD